VYCKMKSNGSSGSPQAVASNISRRSFALTWVCAVPNLCGFFRTAPPIHRQTTKLMGTFCEIQICHSDASLAQQAIRRAFDEIERVSRLLSNHDPESELSVLNREASRSPFRVSEELLAFIRRCRVLYEATDNAFDPTVGPLVRAWGFFTSNPGKPSDRDIAAAKAISGFDKVQVNEAARTVSFVVAGMEIDSGGIGKGYAVDRAVQVLSEQGINAALVSAGGSTLYALGCPVERPGWRIAIKNPADLRRPLALVDLCGCSLSTSGVSEKSVQVGSRRYSHIFDPRTGEPVEGMCQVTVIAPRATESDALTKAAFILPRDSVINLFRSRSGVHALRMEGPCGERSVWITPWSSSVFVKNPGTSS
jgi:thiamine biosynthesis lipoprotein